MGIEFGDISKLRFLDQLLTTPRALKLECEKSEFADILEVIDPSEDGYVIWPRFLEVVAALKMKQTDDGDDEEEVEEAFRLFTKGEKITAADLRRIAEDLKEHVTEEQIRDMILEAAGGEEGGVGRRRFGEVMRRAGAL
jgi:Ca2+-binding EF-hand superfamily protein